MSTPTQSITNSDKSDDISHVSSAPSRLSYKLEGNISQSTNTLSTKLKLFLGKGTLKLEEKFLQRLETSGYTTPSLIVNAFGLDINTVAKSFINLGDQFIFNTPNEPIDMESQGTLLHMFARSQILDGKMNKNPKVHQTWKAMKKDNTYDSEFNN